MNYIHDDPWANNGLFDRCDFCQGARRKRQVDSCHSVFSSFAEPLGSRGSSQGSRSRILDLVPEQPARLCNGKKSSFAQLPTKTKNLFARWGKSGDGSSAQIHAMADKEDRNKENVSGKFYVDSQCIDCDLCRETAPKNFTRSDDEGYSYVYKQPETSEEEEQCREAMEGCPVEAIGEDGE
jgi:ferredoxin